MLVISRTKRNSHLEPETFSKTTLSTSLFAIVLYIICWAITLWIPPRSDKHGYFAALIDKHHRLSTIGSPKIIFIGGSNLAFGLDSPLIESKFHIPVVNMGLCAPLGLRYLLEEVKDDIHSGDIVVLVLEYRLLRKSGIEGSWDLIHPVQVYPYSLLYILRAYTRSQQAFSSLLDLIRWLPTAKWQGCYEIFKEMWDRGYYDPSLIENWEITNETDTKIRFCFNKNGDYVGHCGKPNRPFGINLNLISDTDSEAVYLINNFHSLAKKRGAHVVIIPPPVPGEDLIPSRCSSASIANWPSQKLTVPILARPGRYAFATSLFYQPAYHLNATGRSVRTRLLCEDLEQYFKKMSK